MTRLEELKITQTRRNYLIFEQHSQIMMIPCWDNVVWFIENKPRKQLMSEKYTKSKNQHRHRPPPDFTWTPLI